MLLWCRATGTVPSLLACSRSRCGAMTSTVPVAEGLFTWPSDEPRLIGSRCRACGTTTFPTQASCPRCTGADMEEQLAAPDAARCGRFTVQGFRPKPPYAGPEEFEPYGVGYIELAGPGDGRVAADGERSRPAGDRQPRWSWSIVPFRHDDARRTRSSPSRSGRWPTGASRDGSCGRDRRDRHPPVRPARRRLRARPGSVRRSRRARPMPAWGGPTSSSRSVAATPPVTPTRS